MSSIMSCRKSRVRDVLFPHRNVHASYAFVFRPIPELVSRTRTFGDVETLSAGSSSNLSRAMLRWRSKIAGYRIRRPGHHDRDDRTGFPDADEATVNPQACQVLRQLAGSSVLTRSLRPSKNAGPEAACVCTSV